MTDILGPANADNSVTVRPGETRTFASLDTWFQDCTSPTADDGTEIQASWLNGMLAAARSLWRSNGKMIDGATDVIPETGTDDSGLTKAVQQLIQRGQVAYAIDTGTKNSIVIALGPALKEYKQGVVVRVKMKFANDGPTIINVNGLGNVAVKRTTLADLSPNDLSASGVAVLVHDGAVFQLVSGGAGSAGGAGPQGVQGPAGPQGVPGIQGTQGVQGTQGPQGVPGTFPLTPGSIGSVAFAYATTVFTHPAFNATGTGDYAGTWQTLSLSAADGAANDLLLRQRIA